MSEPCIGDGCMARVNIKGSKFQIDPAVTGLKEYRLVGKRCAAPCAKNSNLCLSCILEEEKYMLGESYTQPTWHGRIDGPLPPYSHIEGSEWNKKLRTKAKPKNTNTKNTSAKNAKTKTQKKTAKKNRNANRTNAPYSEKWNLPV